MGTVERKHPGAYFFKVNSTVHTGKVFAVQFVRTIHMGNHDQTFP